MLYEIIVTPVKDGREQPSQARVYIVNAAAQTVAIETLQARREFDPRTERTTCRAITDSDNVRRIR